MCFGSPKASRYCKSILWKIGFGEPVTVRSRDSCCQWEYRLGQWQGGLKTFHRLLHLPSILKLTAIISPGQSPRPPNQWPIGLVLWKPAVNALIFTLLYFWCVDTFFGNLLLLLTDQNIFLSWSFREIRLGFILRFRCRQEEHRSFQPGTWFEIDDLQLSWYFNYPALHNIAEVCRRHNNNAGKRIFHRCPIRTQYIQYSSQW